MNALGRVLVMVAKLRTRLPGVEPLAVEVPVAGTDSSSRRLPSVLHGGRRVDLPGLRWSLPFLPGGPTPPGGPVGAVSVLPARRCGVRRERGEIKGSRALAPPRSKIERDKSTAMFYDLSYSEIWPCVFSVGVSE